MFKQLKKLFGANAPAPDAGADIHAQPDPQDDLLVNAYCTAAHVTPPAFASQLLGQRDRDDQALLDHLQGFIGYVQSCGDGQMTATRYYVLRHIQRTRQHLSFTLPAGAWDALTAWAEGANALLFLPDGHVRDAHGRILVAENDGLSEPGATVPFPAAAWERKARTDADLAARGHAVPPHLPPVLADSEVVLRDPHEVAGRVLALFLVALRAESLGAGEPIPVADLRDKLPAALPWLTPAELAFLEAGEPSEHETLQFSWRYESLFLLQWALGLADTLPYPDSTCDVSSIARLMLSRDHAALLQDAALRPAAEILDALDLHYRLHWRVRQAQVEGKPAPEGLDAGVILERHHALNWLVRFEDSDWDDVDTPT